MLQNKSCSVISSSIWQHFPGNVNSCNIDKVQLRRKNKAQHERQCRPAADGGTGALGLWGVQEFFQAPRWGQQLHPSWLLLWGQRLRPQGRWIPHSKERVPTPCCLQSSPSSPAAAMERGFVPLTLKVGGKLNCTAHVPHTGCRTGILFTAVKVYEGTR